MPTVYEVISAKAKALHIAALNMDAKSVRLGLEDLEGLMPYFKQEVYHNEFDEEVAETLRP